MFALNLNEEGRILSATFAQYAPPGAALVDSLPEGDITDWLYQGGEYIYEPLPEPEPTEPVEPDGAIWAAMAEAIRAGVNDV